jgi:2-keto-4-pentenoate hydratase/2-oxohepta-3-ene-1,7-dioic acid hydratase in catechol pathway
MDMPLGKSVCVGRNYAEHARELGNEVPSEPLLFMKPASALCSLHEPLRLPQGQGKVHHEVEMVVMIGERLSGETDLETIRYAIKGYGIGLDLTLREVQSRLKEKGQPWERAKAFDGSAPVSGFVEARGVSVRQSLAVSLEVNGASRQHGYTADMLFPTFELIAIINGIFTLEPGDLIFTGTPAGVGPLAPGDTLAARLGNIVQVFTEVA